VCFALGLVNATWDLSILITDACLCPADIAYFQSGYLWDHLHSAAYALGAMLSTLYQPLGDAIGGILIYLLNVPEIVWQVGIDFVFGNVYNFTGDPFAPLGAYCLANNTAGFENFLLIFNNSGAFGQLFGCNATLSPFPLESPLSTCDDSVVGCFVFNLYRFLGFTADNLIKFVCWLSTLVQFNSNLQPTWLGINLDLPFRYYINLATCWQNLLYLLDVPSLGDPPDETCIYVQGGQTLYKASFACAFGNLIAAAWLAVGSVAYEILHTVQLVLAAFEAPPIPGVVVQVPTLQAATADLDVALCMVGQVIGGLFPLTFNCSSQAINMPPFPPNPFLPPTAEAQTGTFPPVVPPADRFNTPDQCTFSRADWSADPASPCNCTVLNLVNPLVNNAPPSPACFLECLQPGATFPYLVGNPISPNPAELAEVNFTYAEFTTPSAIRVFLCANLFPGVNGSFPPIGPLNPTPVVDPTTNGTGGFPPAEFVAEVHTRHPSCGHPDQVLTAQLNWLYQSLYNPLFVLVLNSQWANLSNPFCGGALNQTAAAAADPAFISPDLVGALPGTQVGEVIDALGRWQYSSGNFNVHFWTSFFQGFITPGVVNPIAQTAAVIPGVPVFAWNITADALLPVLRAYNQAYERCVFNTNYSSCFTEVRTLQPSNLPSRPPLSATNGTDNNTNIDFISFTPLDLAQVVTSSDCDCFGAPYTTFARYWGNVTARATDPVLGACLLFCDPIALPYLVGSRPADCLTLGFCQGFTGVEIDTIGGLRDVLSSGQPGTVGTMEYITRTGLTAIDHSQTGALAGYLLASQTAIDYLHRYMPTQSVFLRTLGDPLMTPTACINNSADRILFAGVDMGLIVEMMTKLFYADLNPTWDCNSWFATNTSEYSFCNRWTATYNFTTPTASNAVYQDFAYNHILPLLQLFVTWRPRGNFSLATNDCFVLGTALTNDQLGNLGTDLGNIPNISGSMGLPPISFLDPQCARCYDSALPQIFTKMHGNIIWMSRRGINTWHFCQWLIIGRCVCVRFAFLRRSGRRIVARHFGDITCAQAPTPRRGFGMIIISVLGLLCFPKCHGHSPGFVKPVFGDRILFRLVGAISCVPVRHAILTIGDEDTRSAARIGQRPAMVE